MQANDTASYDISLLMTTQRHWNLSFWPAEWICSLLLHFQLETHSTSCRQVFLNALATQDLYKKKKKSQSCCTITVMRDSSQFRNVEWKFLFLQPLHSASSAWVPPPLPPWGPHSRSWQTQVNLCLNTGKMNIHYCLAWHLSWPTRNTESWTVEMHLIQQWPFCSQHQGNLGKPTKAQNLWTGGIFREVEPCTAVVWGLKLT